MKKAFSFLGMAILGGILTLGGYKMLFNEQIVIERTIRNSIDTVQSNFNPTYNSKNSIETATNFTVAAERTIHSVVHVKNTAIRTQTNSADLFFGFGNGQRKYEQVGTGSGVIISPDGYIVTNNHVIDGATELEITLNNKSKYRAKLIGRDAANDIALLKIEADSELTYVSFADSDNIKIGEWVLAVGNPYNLTSTVTAGIISAKGRDLEGNRNIESFIQTDAAVNPGNSGGALVNSKGELIGINTAISSKTGSFIGYSFAVPSNIAKKIIDDILEFGAVQEAILGINIDSSDENIEGVKIASVLADGGANNAGLKPGDIIKKLNNVKISKFSELRGQLTAMRPGQYLDIIISRNGKLITKQVKLSKKDTFVSTGFNIILKDISKSDKIKFDILNGVKIVRNGNKNLVYYGVKKGYIITKINKKPVLNASEASKLLDYLLESRKSVYLEVLNLEGEIEQYAFK
jgi:Do/DeqQ family serine protease